MSNKLYTLSDPRELGNVRYVGITVASLSKRLYNHLYNARKGDNNHRCCWIRKLLAEGIQPKIELVAVLPTWEDACEAEKCEIKILLEDGYKLVNGTAGGDGCVGLKHTDETRKKLGAISRGRKHSAETRKKIGEISRGNKNTLGFKHSKESRLKMSIASKKREISAETRKKMGRSLCRPILCTTTHQIFASMKEAVLTLGLHSGNVSAVCRGKRSHAGGYHFKYITNEQDSATSSNTACQEHTEEKDRYSKQKENK